MNMRWRDHYLLCVTTARKFTQFIEPKIRKFEYWTEGEVQKLMEATERAVNGNRLGKWDRVSQSVGTRSRVQCANKYYLIRSRLKAFYNKLEQPKNNHLNNDDDGDSESKNGKKQLSSWVTWDEQEISRLNHAYTLYPQNWKKVCCFAHSLAAIFACIGFNNIIIPSVAHLFHVRM